MNRNGSLRRTLLLAFILVIGLLSTITFYTMQFMYRYHRETAKMLDTIFYTTNLSVMLGESHQVLTNTINYRDPVLVPQFTEAIEETVQYVKTLDQAMLLFAREVEDMNAYYRFLDIQKAVLTYREKSLVLTRQFLSDQESRVQLYDSLYELRNLKNSVSDLQNELLFRQSVNVQAFYKTTSRQISRGMYGLIGITSFILVLCVFFSFLISRRVSVPIHELGEAAAAIGSGAYNAVSINRGTNREIANLIHAFNDMSRQLKTRRDIEQRLQEEEVKNLQMDNMLRRSEMKLLQSRIHPHFLFNTLHMIATLTQIEEAPRTEQMLNSLSNLLRYILNKADQQTTLKEELSIVKDYLCIQTARFGDRIEFRLDLEDDVETCVLPALSLQPFVENSIIHGLEPKKERGTLSIGCSKIYENGLKMLSIKISDDGEGMSVETLAEVCNVDQSLASGKHLGIANTIRRLELLSHTSRVSIQSIEHRGTTVEMRLPLDQNEPDAEVV